MSHGGEIIDLVNDEGECLTVTFDSSSGFEVIDLSTVPVRHDRANVRRQELSVKPGPSVELCSMVDLTAESQSSTETSDLISEEITGARLRSENRPERRGGIECFVCYRFRTEITSGKCGHVLCVECMGKVLEGNNAKCPVCREKISKRQLRRIYC
eukprot:g6931.t1